MKPHIIGLVLAVLLIGFLLGTLRHQVEDLSNAVNALQARFPGDTG